MHVVATAGHVDHGKSTLVRRLTGTDPDRWAEEHRRGLTLDLGFAWTGLDDGCAVAFVDVPGHERFVGNMLAGVGPVTAVLFVLAADQGWQAQSSEHRDALHALGVRHGLVAITRCDLADPAPAAQQAREQLAGTGMTDLPVCPVSGATGEGFAELRAELDALAHRLPRPDAEAAARIWVDRSFTVRGAGTVVTGTLPAGRVRRGDRLLLHPGQRPVTVRGLQALGEDRAEVVAAARVAVNLRGAEHHEIRRGHALVTPGRWWSTGTVDVRVAGAPVAELPRELVVHAGTASLAARVRPLGADTARLQLREPLPLVIGDRVVLRDPGQHRIAGSACVLDVSPPALRRRGAARQRARALETADGSPDAWAELRRRRIVRAADLRAMGVALPPELREDTAGPWLVDPRYRAEAAERLAEHVAEHERRRPLDGGLAPEAARRALELPDRDLVVELAREAGVVFARGRLRTRDEVPQAAREVAARVCDVLSERPFRSPTSDELAELGAGEAELAAAERGGLLVRLAPGVVLGPRSAEHAAALLADLEQPFTPSQARRALDTSRRVVVPLLEHLDRCGLTRALPDGTHQVRSA
ncbi:selenocysteine-specific translation elongation factor [Salinifilum aidingensis]